MKLIILAAGKGERLHPLTKNTPKPLLDLGDGVTILERQLDAASKNPEIKEVVLVIGYLAEQIEAKIKYYRDKGVKLKLLYNPFFDVSNNLMSLWMARHEMDGDFILTNGDNIFKPELLKKVIDNPGDGIFLTIDKLEEYNEDDMKVMFKDGEIARVSKEIPAKSIEGESIGVAKVCGSRFRMIFLEMLDELARDASYRDKFWLEVLNRLVDKGHSVKPIEVSTSDWREIDFHMDIDDVKKILLNGKKLWN